jgi:hypothetical protein
VPRISEFYGIVIAMFYNDHDPPHFHAIYGEFRASVAIEPIGLIEGRLPTRAANLVFDWARLHTAELKADWDLARRHEPLEKIAPLE